MEKKMYYVNVFGNDGGYMKVWTTNEERAMKLASAFRPGFSHYEATPILINISDLPEKVKVMFGDEDGKIYHNGNYKTAVHSEINLLFGLKDFDLVFSLSNGTEDSTVYIV